MTEWAKRLNLQSVKKPELNQLVLNYLIFEGYESTAVKFAKEIGIDLESSDNIAYDGITSIEFRKEIKLSLLNGDIQLVIDKLKFEYPDLLEKNQFLHFKLLLLNLIEMIKSHNEENRTVDSGDKDEFILSIIDFARKKLANKALKNSKFMEELELTMTLLLYSNNEQNEKLPDKLKELLESKLRKDIAGLINKAIILENVPHLLDFNTEDQDNSTEDRNDDESENFYHNNQLIDSNLKKLIKLWLWGENQLGDYKEGEFKKFDI
jgi:hypothetical protein